jgi:hypothetical protein
MGYQLELDSEIPATAKAEVKEEVGDESREVGTGTKASNYMY